MMKTIIAAKSKNNVIGKEGKIPWYLPEDLQFFKLMTMGHYIVMGRKTYEDLSEELEGRKVIVLTRNCDYKNPACIIKNSLKSAFNYAKTKGEKELFIAGGKSIYRASISKADKMYLTEIPDEHQGDTYFPDIDPHKWKKKKLVQFWRKEEEISTFSIFRYTSKK